MDNYELRDHLDARLDKIEEKLDSYIIKTAENTISIAHVQGFSKIIISILIALFGFFALAFFQKLP